MALQAKLSVVGRRAQLISRDKSMSRMNIHFFNVKVQSSAPLQTTHGIFIRRLENFLRSFEDQHFLKIHYTGIL